jgi:hypothetical protein
MRHYTTHTAHCTLLVLVPRGFGTFLREQKIKDALLLTDNLSSQTKAEFKSAVLDAGAKELWFGPPNASHVWQPDHHVGATVGARYKQMMGQKYDDFMLEEYKNYPDGKKW